MAKRVKPKKKEPVKFCDPAVCDNCVYIGEGDFFCDKTPEMVCVVSDWEPTDNYLWCPYGTLEAYQRRGL